MAFLRRMWIILRFFTELHLELFVFFPMVAVDQQDDDDQQHDQSSGRSADNDQQLVVSGGPAFEEDIWWISLTQTHSHSNKTTVTSFMQLFWCWFSSIVSFHAFYPSQEGSIFAQLLQIKRRIFSVFCLCLKQILSQTTNCLPFTFRSNFDTFDCYFAKYFCTFT